MNVAAALRRCGQDGVPNSLSRSERWVARRIVFVQHSAVGSGGRGGAVGVETQLPAPGVHGQEVVKTTGGDQIPQVAVAAGLTPASSWLRPIAMAPILPPVAELQRLGSDDLITQDAGQVHHVPVVSGLTPDLLADGL